MKRKTKIITNSDVYEIPKISLGRDRRLDVLYFSNNQLCNQYVTI